MQDLVELVDVVTALEEGLAAEEFSEDASYGPDVDWKVILAGFSFKIMQ